MDALLVEGFDIDDATQHLIDADGDLEKALATLRVMKPAGGSKKSCRKNKKQHKAAPSPVLPPLSATASSEPSTDKITLSLEETINAIADMVVEKCVYRETKQQIERPFVIDLMSKMRFHVKAGDNVKKQGTKLIKTLEASEHGVQRAAMRVKVTHSKALQDEAAVAGFRAAVVAMVSCVESETDIDEENNRRLIHAILTRIHAMLTRIHDILTPINAIRCLVCQMAPVSYRDLEALVDSHSDLAPTVEVLQLAVREKAPEASELEAPASTSHAAPGETADVFTTATAPGVEFASRDELREHMRSEWHKYNIGRKSRKARMVTRDEHQAFVAGGPEPSDEPEAAPEWTEADDAFFSRGKREKKKKDKPKPVGRHKGRSSGGKRETEGENPSLVGSSKHRGQGR